MCISICIIYAAQVGRAKTLSCRRYGAEKETLAYLRMPGIGKNKDTDLGLCQDPDQVIKKASLSSVVALGKGNGLQSV